jgi:signal transduction histidine kinase
MKRAIAPGLIVVLAVGLATGLTAASFALGADLSFEWYVAAVACVAWGSGRTAAVWAAIVSSAVLDFFFLPVHQVGFGMEVTDAGRLVVFLGVALLVAHLVARRELAEVERVRREWLLAMVAHELGNMIFALRTWTSVLQREGPRSDALDSAAQALARTADAITKLAGDLMDWSRIALGKVDLHLEDVELAEVARDAVEEMRGQAAQAGVRLSSSLARTAVRADPDRLHQVALNLLVNSLKATARGGEVVVSVHPVDRRGRFSVRDTGRGIPPDTLRRLFDRRALRSENEGLGLGLALSRDIVRAQGGDLTVQSGGLGMGATFSVDLPAV